MKRLIKRISGVLMSLVGLMGLLFSLYAVRETWLTADRMGREVPYAFGQLESVGQSVHRQGVAAVDVLETTRNRLNSILVTVEDLSRNRQERQVATVLDRLDTEVVDRLEHAEEFVRSMQSSLESASRAILLLESIPFLGPRVSAPAVSNQSTYTTLASSLSDVSRGLGQMTQILSEIRTTRTADPAHLAQLTNVLQGIDEQLHEMESDIADFTAETNILVTSLADARRKSRRWIERTAVWCTLFFVCFAFSQLHLLAGGCQALRAEPLTVTSDVPE